VSLLSDFRDFTAEIVAEFGAPAVLTVPAGVGSVAGSVTETPTDYAVTVAGPVDESKRWAALATDARVVATFYVAAKTLAVTPAPGHRITYQGRRFIVLAAQPYTVQGGTIAHRLDCGEVGVDG
jgi:hypothetical protein